MNHVTTSVEYVLMVVKTGMLEHVVLMVRNIDFFCGHTSYILVMWLLWRKDTNSLATA